MTGCSGRSLRAGRSRYGLAGPVTFRLAAAAGYQTGALRPEGRGGLPPTHKRHTHKRPRGSAGAPSQGGERGDAAPSQDQGGVDQLECQLGAMQETYQVTCGQQQAEALKTLLHEAGQVRLPASGRLSQQQLREYGDSVTQAVRNATATRLSAAR